jgi:hypothetical protein
MTFSTSMPEYGSGHAVCPLLALDPKAVHTSWLILACRCYPG